MKSLLPHPADLVADNTPAISDEDLMQAIIARDTRALDQLYARYRPLLAKIVTEKIGRAHV